jgi:hypothetical protein
MHVMAMGLDNVGLTTLSREGVGGWVRDGSGYLRHRYSAVALSSAM